MDYPHSRFFLAVQMSPDTWQYPDPPTYGFSTSEELLASEYTQKVMDTYRESGKSIVIMKVSYVYHLNVAQSS